MTHTRQMTDDEGDFTAWKPSMFKCPKCSSIDVHYRTWESKDGAYEDEQYRCAACQHVWWIDGIDS